jgi:two-component system CheB/CheR fusion protein
MRFLPEVVLLDIGLPELDGYEVAKRLRTEPALHDALLVAITGYGHKNDVLRAKDAGFDHHLIKPIEPEALNGVIAQIKRPQPSPLQ